MARKVKGAKKDPGNVLGMLFVLSGCPTSDLRHRTPQLSSKRRALLAAQPKGIIIDKDDLEEIREKVLH